MKVRLDEKLVKDGLAQSRSQAANLIKLGKVSVGGKKITKAGYKVDRYDAVHMADQVRYVSRAGFKLESANDAFKIDFRDKTLLDVGSSTGGFTDYALQNGIKKVIAVDVGTDQLHPSLVGHDQIDLHEKTDIRDFKTNEKIDIVVIDVSFISMREVLPSVADLSNKDTLIIAMLKPQFEAGDDYKHKGVIKNSKMRRSILQDFEVWVKQAFVIKDSQDSAVAGAKGNQERFYLLKTKS